MAWRSSTLVSANWAKVRTPCWSRSSAISADPLNDSQIVRKFSGGLGGSRSQNADGSGRTCGFQLQFELTRLQLVDLGNQCLLVSICLVKLGTQLTQLGLCLNHGCIMPVRQELAFEIGLSQLGIQRLPVSISLEQLST